MVWHGGGHDGGLDESDRIENLTLAWFEDHLAERKSAGTDFEITLRSGPVISNNSDQQFEIFSRPEYPGLNGSSTEAITVGEAGVGQQIIRPAGGVPANITVLPGVSGGLSSLVNRPLPNQSAVFDSAVLENSYFISGSSSVSLQVSAVEVVPEATLFVSLRIVGDGQRETLPNGLVTPVRVFNVGPDPQTVEVELPTIVQEVNPGEKLRIVVTTTDFGYRMPLAGAQYEVALADNTMQLATANNFTNFIKNTHITKLILNF
jgi:ABC-2 type transport system ATP-binding protein